MWDVFYLIKTLKYFISLQLLHIKMQVYDHQSYYFKNYYFYFCLNVMLIDLGNSEFLHYQKNWNLIWNFANTASIQE